jgi:hypothetical protein
MKWLCVLVLVVGCKKAEKAPPPTNTNNDPAIPAAELKRGEDACNALVKQACACAETVPAAQAQCDSAKAFPEVVRMGTELTMSTDSSGKDVKQAVQTIRKTISECIQQTAQLPTLGCPAP